MFSDTKNFPLPTTSDPHSHPFRRPPCSSPQNTPSSSSPVPSPPPSSSSSLPYPAQAQRSGSSAARRRRTERSRLAHWGYAPVRRESKEAVHECSAYGCRCLRGLGYQPGDQLGKIVSRFPGVGVFYLISKVHPLPAGRPNTPLPALLFLILGTITHVYFLPRLHLIRDTRLSWIMLIVPAGCSLLLLICVIINFALVAQLRNDPIFQSGLPNDGDVSPQIEATNPLSTAPSSTNAPIPSSYISDAPVSNNPPPSELLPSGTPRKLSLRALTSSTGLDASTSSTSLTAEVSAQGVSYLYVPSPAIKPFLTP